jgi:hypothetical protein
VADSAIQGDIQQMDIWYQALLPSASTTLERKKGGIPSSRCNRRIRIVRVLPNTTSNSLTDTYSNTNRRPNHQQRDDDLDPDLGPLIQTRHTSTHIMLISLSAHRLLLHLHSILARPNRTFWITALALEEACSVCGVWSQGFDIRVVGGIDHVDVLLRFGFLRFERIACRSGVVEWRERRGFALVGFLVLRPGWGEGMRGVHIFDCAQDFYRLVRLLADIGRAGDGQDICRGDHPGLLVDGGHYYCGFRVEEGVMSWMRGFGNGGRIGKC